MIKQKLMIFSALLVFIPLLFSALIIGYIVKSSIDDQSAQSMEKDARIAAELYKNRELLIVQVVQNSSQAISAQGLFDLTQAPAGNTAPADPKSATGRVQEEGAKKIASLLTAVQETGKVDFIVVTDSKGNIIARQAQGQATGAINDNPLIVSVQNAVTAGRTYAQSSSVKESLEKLTLLAGEELAKRAEIKAEGRAITDGLVIEAAAPITNNSGRLLGIVLAGLLVNNSPQKLAIVEDIKTQLYPSLLSDAGVSITLNDVIVSTNIPIPQNGALGKRTTVAPSDTPKTSVENFDETYKSAYVPIKDSSNQVIGRIGVQVKQSWFNAVLNKVLLIILLIVLVFILGAIGVAIFAAQKLTKPIIELTEASNNISLGKLDESIQIKSDDEIGQLAEALERMRISLKQALDRLRSKRAQQN